MLALPTIMLPLGAQAQSEPMTTKRATELRESPTDTAKSVASLPAQTSLTRQAERSGPWMQVRTSTGAVGWVHMFDIGNAGSPSTAPGSGIASGFLRGVAGLFNKGGAQQNATVATSTVGIRGLDAQDLANAQPDINRVNQMEANRVEAIDAQQFAAASGVERREVPPLEAP
ncbi:MAG: SH3 domain-containing protein [Hylemonella sp.]|nr:SH3 domain-containing protein [Hylemonella sp.]